MIRITSTKNPRVKDALRLRDRRHREKQERILIEGFRELNRAIDGGVSPLQVFFCPAMCQADSAQQLLSRLAGAGAEVFEVTEPVFSRLAFGQRAEGIVAVAAMPRSSLAQLSLPPVPLVAVLEGVEKPGNLGAVIRSADGAGVSAVVLADGRTDLYNPAAIRASLGTVFTLPVCAATSAEVLQWLFDRGVSLYAARVDGRVPYTEVDFRRPAAVILGSEATGLGRLWSRTEVTPIRLPMLGRADSLNVSAAAAVLFYEARRQRDQG